MREMRAGQWVAFDASTDKAHKCGKKNKEDPNIKKLAKDRSKEKEQESGGIDLGYDDENQINVSDEVAINEGFYTTQQLIKKNIDKAIKNGNKVSIDYKSEFTQEQTTREISPIKKFQYKNKSYLQSYCHLRKAQRSFLITSIEQLTFLNKKIFKPKKVEDPNIAEFVEKFNETNNEIVDEVYIDNTPPKVEGKYKVEIIDKPKIKEPSPNIDYQEPTVSSEETKTFGWYLWRLMLAVWAFGIINWLLGCPFADC
tara:strand:- start:3207 stop:3971 length:765 start_codon:yes stop_codon:yes gene_type:complete